jgi:hypothetical protein
MRANLEQNRAVAVGFSPPTIARAVQVKGIVAAVGEPETADLERVERHFRSFVAEAERVGAPAALAERMFVREGLVAVSLSIDEVFDQTPGRQQAAVCERALGSARVDRSLPAGRPPFLARDLLGGRHCASAARRVHTQAHAL